MEELKNEWHHFMIDPVLSIPYKNEIIKCKNLDELYKNKKLSELSIQNLNDKILYNIIINEWKEKIIDQTKESTIEFIFTREFKN